MLNLLSLLIGGLVIAGIARYNKSNKLFWELMMSFLFGFACGHVGKSYKAYTDKKPGITVVTAMQPSMALTISDATFPDVALPDDICVLNEGSRTIPAMAKVALAENDNCRDIIQARDHLTFNAEDDIGICEPINSS